jgi:exodeoxyribonuclease V beta subunit
MIFDIPVSPSGPTVTLAELADLLESHLDPADPMRAYGDRIRTLSRTTFHGFLTGAIDATVRLGSTRSGSGSWTTRPTAWATRTRPLTLDDYRPAALDRAMLHGDYVLQSLLYQVALHRYLAVRVPGYRPRPTWAAACICSCGA